MAIRYICRQPLTPLTGLAGLAAGIPRLTPWAMHLSPLRGLWNGLMAAHQRGGSPILTPFVSSHRTPRRHAMKAFPVLSLALLAGLPPLRQAMSGEAFELRDGFAAYRAGSDGAPAWES